LRALLGALETELGDLDGRVTRLEGRHATEAELRLVHPEAHVDRIREAVGQATDNDCLIHIDPDTVVSPRSWDAALAGAGTLLTAVDAILDDSAANAFCAPRPPGHHATADRAMGFCLFNNVAIGARYARERGLLRSLIVDWDVHHGNGTEAIFYEDPDAFYLSMHQSPHYPGTGHRRHRGHGPGEGANLNLPMPPGLPAQSYVDRLLAGLESALSGFKPDIIFVSAGFDAAYGDPLAGFTLTPGDYHALTLRLKEIAAEHCEGRLISALEGGYEPDMLADCGLAHIRALAGFVL
jgi:acetoin utilization deacetylase AcuC-like enzyme